MKVQSVKGVSRAWVILSSPSVCLMLTNTDRHLTSLFLAGPSGNTHFLRKSQREKCGPYDGTGGEAIPGKHLRQEACWNVTM